ncbi:Oleosin [Heracleum sosnowskyi]|uniref:Oleosin n=1 Tax=Heracleum sosnowskyi TaxID=360622 RepID=A0AAD8IDM9_9APIA|nr:Oleosin [Heracleum sosnowskyi]
MAGCLATSRVLAIITLLPIGGTLLGLAGITFIGTVIGLGVAAPLFIIFSPVIVPAALAIGLAVTGVIASEAFGISGLLSLLRLLSLFMQTIKDKAPDGGKGAQPRVQMGLE